MFPIFGAIAKGLSVLRGLIGQPLRVWAEWAQENPRAAAEQLEAAAIVLRHRARAVAMKRGNGAWAVRRDRALADAAMEIADGMRTRGVSECRQLQRLAEDRLRDAKEL